MAVAKKGSKMRIHLILLTVGIGALVYGAFAVDRGAGAQSQAERLFARAKADDYTGDMACAECHEGKVAKFSESPHASLVSDPKLPADKRGCEGCHGPGKLHTTEEGAEVIAYRKMSPKESSAACLRCHSQTLSENHWKRTAHARADLSCVSCHQIHPDSDPDLQSGTVNHGTAQDTKAGVFVAQKLTASLLRAEEPKLCGQCHAPQVAQFRLTSHHPIPEGAMACSSCHSTHPSKSAKSKVATEKTDCITCHREVAGPFTFEHDPVANHTGAACQECHRPHGSNNPKLLTSFSRGLCAQCHTEKLARHYPGRTCWNAGCHVAPHGSNTNEKFLEP